MVGPPGGLALGGEPGVDAGQRRWPPAFPGAASGKTLHLSLLTFCSLSPCWVSHLERTGRRRPSGLFVSRCPACFPGAGLGGATVEGGDGFKRFPGLAGTSDTWFFY